MAGRLGGIHLAGEIALTTSSMPSDRPKALTAAKAKK